MDVVQSGKDSVTEPARENNVSRKFIYSRWQRQAEIQNILKERFHPVFQAVINAMEDTPRASSIVENFNGRLRSYFFLRRHLGTDYLELLKFYLNHSKFPRSRKPERREIACRTVDRSTTPSLASNDWFFGSSILSLISNLLYFDTSYFPYFKD